MSGRERQNQRPTVQQNGLARYTGPVLLRQENWSQRSAQATLVCVVSQLFLTGVKNLRKNHLRKCYGLNL